MADMEIDPPESSSTAAAGGAVVKAKAKSGGGIVMKDGKKRFEVKKVLRVLSIVVIERC